MFAGASTACLYPEQTEKSLAILGESGIKNIELFVNAACETEGDIFSEILRVKKTFDLNIISLHPYTSFLETFTIFGDYPRRFDETIEFYKRFFRTMNALEAKIFVFHGAMKDHEIPFNLFAERYSRLYEIGKSFGITVSLENVHYCESGSLKFLTKIKDALGESCAFVLDIKQALRSNIDPFLIMNALGDKIKHYHVSDHTAENDCVPVGKGSFDFAKFADKLKRLDYSGGVILELYRNGYRDVSELYESVKYMDMLLK